MKLFIIILSVTLTSCIPSYSRKNFDDSVKVGISGLNFYKIDISKRNDLQKTQPLLNGNIAYHFGVRAVNPSLYLYTICDIYYEVNPKTNKIIGYTITDENADRDCKQSLMP
jgi:hypothetical protein